MRRHKGRRNEKATEKEQTYVADQFSIVEIALEDNQFALSQVPKEVRVCSGQTPVAARVRPETVGADDELAGSVKSTQVLEKRGEVFHFSSREGFRCLPIVALIILRDATIESLRIRQRVQQSPEIGRYDIRDEPGDRFWVQDNGGREVRREQVSGENQIDEELEAGVVEHNVDSAVLVLTGRVVFRGAEDLIRGGEVVGQDVFLRRLARRGALEFLDVFVGEGGQEGEVGGVAPEAYLGHFGEDGFLGVCEVIGSFGTGFGIILGDLRG